MAMTAGEFLGTIQNRKIDEHSLRLYLQETQGNMSFDSENSTYVFSNFCIEDESIVVNSFHNYVKRIVFRDCYFKPGNGVTVFEKLANMNRLEFDHCFFEGQLKLNQLKNDMNVTIKNTWANCIHFYGGDYKQILVECLDNCSLVFVIPTFTNLLVSGKKTETADLLKLELREETAGRILIQDKAFKTVEIAGSYKATMDVRDMCADVVQFSNFINNGAVNFVGLQPSFDIDGLYYVEFSDSNLGSAQFHRAAFSSYDYISVIDSFITECLFLGCNWGANIRSATPAEVQEGGNLRDRRTISIDEYKKIKEAYRQLKISMAKHSDKISEAFFYGQEMTAYTQTLREHGWKSREYWDKLILKYSRVFSNYGHSFRRPLFYLFVVYFPLYFLVLACCGFSPLHINFTNATWKGFVTGFEKFWIYINPLRGEDTSLPGLLNVMDVCMRIWCSFMIYNIIRATRRFIP